MGVFDIFKKKKKTKKPTAEKSIKKTKPLSGTIKGSATITGTLTKEKKDCKGKHDFKLFSVSGQRVIACKDCGKREANRFLINLKTAQLVKQD